MHVTTARFSSSRFTRSALAASAAALPSGARAHGFGQRFDLPLPLWFWLSGAAATIALTLLAVALFGRPQPGAAAPARVPASVTVALPRSAELAIGVLRVAAALLFLVTLWAGFFGSQSPYANLINTMVWVIWWVGLAFVCALVGDVWAWLSPLDSLFAAAERVFERFGGRSLSLGLPYPSRLGAWPAVLLYFCFAWCELVWSAKDVPASLAAAVAGYAALTWLGMWLFGRAAWLRHGEAFAIVFALFGRFAPLALRRGAGVRTPVQLVVRGWGVGLLRSAVPAWSAAVFVLLMLATVTFDGFKEVPAMQRLEAAVRQVPLLVAGLFELSERGLDESQVIQTIVLLAFAVAFVAALWLTSRAILALARRAVPGAAACARLSPRAVACRFVLSLVPIAVAYHLAHYFSLLLTAGQFIIPLASDPFGFGWNLFGTAGYRVDLALVSPYVLWYGAVVLIVSGHVIAVLLAHAAALRLFRDHRLALWSELPMTALMILYTMLSLWILAQPIVG